MFPACITYSAAAERYHCSEKTLARAVRAGDIRAYRPGREVVIDQESADRWFESRAIKPVLRRGRPRKGQSR